jgi:hypothetical protein
MNVKLSWVERFINWFPGHTRLYIRGAQGKPRHEIERLWRELFGDLKPFLAELRDEAYREGYEAGYVAAKCHIPRSEENMRPPSLPVPGDDVSRKAQF